MNSKKKFKGFDSIQTSETARTQVLENTINSSKKVSRVPRLVLSMIIPCFVVVGVFVWQSDVLNQRKELRPMNLPSVGIQSGFEHNMNQPKLTFITSVSSGGLGVPASSYLPGVRPTEGFKFREVEETMIVYTKPKLGFEEMDMLLNLYLKEFKIDIDPSTCRSIDKSKDDWEQEKSNCSYTFIPGSGTEAEFNGPSISDVLMFSSYEHGFSITIEADGSASLSYESPLPKLLKGKTDEFLEYADIMKDLTNGEIIELLHETWVSQVVNLDEYSIEHELESYSYSKEKIVNSYLVKKGNSKDSYLLDRYQIYFYLNSRDYDEISLNIGLKLPATMSYLSSYDIIPKEEALEKLNEGKIIANAVWKFAREYGVGEDGYKVIDSELTYLNDPSNSVTLPIYRFYVEIQKTNDIEGLISVVQLDVLAIDEGFVDFQVVTMD